MIFFFRKKIHSSLTERTDRSSFSEIRSLIVSRIRTIREPIYNRQSDPRTDDDADKCIPHTSIKQWRNRSLRRMRKYVHTFIGWLALLHALTRIAMESILNMYFSVHSLWKRTYVCLMSFVAREWFFKPSIQLVEKIETILRRVRYVWFPFKHIKSVRNFCVSPACNKMENIWIKCMFIYIAYHLVTHSRVLPYAKVTYSLFFFPNRNSSLFKLTNHIDLRKKLLLRFISVRYISRAIKSELYIPLLILLFDLQNLYSHSRVSLRASRKETNNCVLLSVTDEFTYHCYICV